MKFNTTFKKFACLLLALLMLLGTVGCKDNGGSKKKKKVIIKKKVIVENNDDESNNDNNQSNIEIVAPGDTEQEEPKEEVKTLPERPLPEVLLEEAYEEWKEPYVPEFEHEYKALNITEDYVIVYALEDWTATKRQESATKVDNGDGTYSLKTRYITSTGFSRLAAYDLQKYFKDKLDLKLDVQKDTAVAADAKKILVGDTIYSPSNSLAENEFAVRVDGDNLVIEGGHFAMVTKAAKWYESLEVKPGQVATLKGKTDDFKTQVTLNGITYDYVWGDEFDGYEFINAESWGQSTFGDERSDDFISVMNDPYFHYVENGRLRLTADRYYDESNPAMGYASSGDTNTEGRMQFRNGYFEFRARLPYRRGAFPAIWTMSNVDNKKLPNYDFDDGYGQFNKVYWTIEFDLFESFADADHMTTTIHKWYSDAGIGASGDNPSISVPDTQVKLTDEQIVDLAQRAADYKYYSWLNDTNKIQFMMDEEDVEKYGIYSKSKDKYAFDTSILTKDVTDEDGNVVDKEFVYYPIYLLGDHEMYEDGKLDIFDYRLRPFTNMNKNGNTYAYSFTYPGTGSENIVGSVKDGIYDWTWQFDPATINNEYHIYAFHYTSDHCTVSMDGVPFLDFDWDPAYDYFDANGDGKIADVSYNNNGVGFNLWHYFIIDMMIYTPNNFKIDEARKLVKGDYPFNLYIDWVRCYQDLDDPSQALWFPNGAGDNAQ